MKQSGRITNYLKCQVYIDFKHIITQWYHVVYKVYKNYRQNKPKSIKRTTFVSKYAACNSKKSWFIKKQETTGLLSQLGIKIPLSKLPLLCDILF